MLRRLVPLLLAGACLASCHKPPEKVPDPDFPQKLMPGELESQCNRLYRLNPRGKRISWKGSVPVSFNLDPSFPPAFASAFESAIQSWNLAAGLELFKFNGYRADSSIPAFDHQNTVYFLSLDDLKFANEPGSIAATRVYVRGNKIFDADIVYDGVNRKFDTNRMHFNSFDVEAIALHELGHALGLAHNDNPLSIMYFGNSAWGYSSRTIDPVSRQIISCEY